jgi:hypothetical protein
MGPSLMHRGPAARAGPADPDLGQGRVDLVDPADIRDLVDLDRVDLDRVARVGPADIRDLVDLDRVDLVGLDRVDLVGLDRVDLVGLDRVDLVGLDRVDLVDPADIRDLVDLDRVARVDPVDLMDIKVPVDRVDLVAPVDRAVRDRVDRVDRVAPAVRVDPVDLHRRLTGRVALSIGVAPRWAAPEMCRTASARPATVRRLRRHNTDGAGMAGLRPERRRRSGTDRHPRVDGTVHRLRVVGTAHGTVRRAISQSRSVISGRSITTGTTRSRCSIQFSVDGASGSSVSGSRCTDTA